VVTFSSLFRSISFFLSESVCVCVCVRACDYPAFCGQLLEYQTQRPYFFTVGLPHNGYQHAMWGQTVQTWKGCGLVDIYHPATDLATLSHYHARKAMRLGTEKTEENRHTNIVGTLRLQQLFSSLWDRAVGCAPRQLAAYSLRQRYLRWKIPWHTSTVMV
jgi:hypothetical protein